MTESSLVARSLAWSLAVFRQDHAYCWRPVSLDPRHRTSVLRYISVHKNRRASLSRFFLRQSPTRGSLSEDTVSLFSVVAILKEFKFSKSRGNATCEWEQTQFLMEGEGKRKNHGGYCRWECGWATGESNCLRDARAVSRMLEFCGFPFWRRWSLGIGARAKQKTDDHEVQSKRIAYT